MKLHDDEVVIKKDIPNHFSSKPSQFKSSYLGHYVVLRGGKILKKEGMLAGYFFSSYLSPEYTSKLLPLPLST